MNEVLQVDLDNDSFPLYQTPNIKTNDVVYMVVDQSDLSTVYTDITGRFSCKSSSGNEYFMIAYHYDGDTIIGRPLNKYKSRNYYCNVAAYEQYILNKQVQHRIHMS